MVLGVLTISAIAAAPASAWQLKVIVKGYGTVEEITPAAEISSTTCRSPNTTATGAAGDTCFGGTPSGDYGHGWIVELDADLLTQAGEEATGTTAEDGWTFAGWKGVSSSGGAAGSYTPVDCDGAEDGAGINTSATCRFQIFGNLAVEAQFEDNVAPKTAVTSGPSGTVNSTNASFSYASDQPGSTFTCLLDGPPEGFATQRLPCPASGKSYSGLGDGGHTFRIAAEDPSGNDAGAVALGGCYTEPSGSPTVFCTRRDHPWTVAVPPTNPPNLAAVASTASSVSLDWLASSDNSGVTGYDVYRNGTGVATTDETNLTVSGLSCATSYEFGVEAFDAAGNRSGRATVTASTAACPPPAESPPPSGGGSSPPVDPAASSAPPLPPPTTASFSRSLTISYSDKGKAFKGKLASTQAACVSGQKVTILEKKPGRDPKVSTGTTSSNGSYSAAERGADGRYYAVAAQKGLPNGDLCLDAKSAAVKAG